MTRTGPFPLPGRQVERGVCRMPKTHDYRHTYRGPGGVLSACRIRVYDTGGGQTVVIATDLGRGTSVTGAVTPLANEIEGSHCADPSRRMLWVEHYRYADTLPGWGAAPVETFHLVTFTRADDGTLTAPRWHRLGRADIEALIGQPVED